LLPAKTFSARPVDAEMRELMVLAASVYSLYFTGVAGERMRWEKGKQQGFLGDRDIHRARLFSALAQSARYENYLRKNKRKIRL
jgi:hypothetical protein